MTEGPLLWRCGKMKSKETERLFQLLFVCCLTVKLLCCSLKSLTLKWLLESESSTEPFASVNMSPLMLVWSVALTQYEPVLQREMALLLTHGIIPVTGTAAAAAATFGGQARSIFIYWSCSWNWRKMNSSNVDYRFEDMSDTFIVDLSSRTQRALRRCSCTTTRLGWR